MRHIMTKRKIIHICKQRNERKSLIHIYQIRIAVETHTENMYDDACEGDFNHRTLFIII